MFQRFQEYCSIKVLVIYTLNHHHNKPAMQEISILATLAVLDFLWELLILPLKDVQNFKITMKKHFHFRYSCRLWFFIRASNFATHKCPKFQNINEKYDYWQIINENCKVILLFSWKVESVFRTVSNIYNGIFRNIRALLLSWLQYFWLK